MRRNETLANASDFKLDTSNMASTANSCKALYEQLQNLRNQLESAKNSLLFTWAGEGRNEFEKQYRLLNQQFSDIIDDTKDMYEKLISAEETYIQTDTNNAKKEAGIDRKI